MKLSRSFNKHTLLYRYGRTLSARRKTDWWFILTLLVGVSGIALLLFRITAPIPYSAQTRPSDSFWWPPFLQHLVSTRTPKAEAPPATSTTTQNTANPLISLSWHTNITTTIFWIGEPADTSNGFIANSASAWDEDWMANFGGFDNPDHRSGYLPAGFTPRENAFYAALPYSDFTLSGKRKSSAAACPNSNVVVQANSSWCKNSWVAIKHGTKTAYAQWEDVGPFDEDDYAYVFGTAAPRNQRGAKAGLDVSPAVRDYLGLQDVDYSDWAFVAASDVPATGPWRQTVTTGVGEAVGD